jgi:hypothetical protein
MSDHSSDAGHGTFDFAAAIAGIQRTAERQNAQMEQMFHSRVISGGQKPAWWQKADPALLVLLAMIAFACLIMAGAMLVFVHAQCN